MLPCVQPLPAHGRNLEEEEEEVFRTSHGVPEEARELEGHKHERREAALFIAAWWRGRQETRNSHTNHLLASPCCNKAHPKLRGISHDTFQVRGFAGAVSLCAQSGGCPVRYDTARQIHGDAVSQDGGFVIEAGE